MFFTTKVQKTVNGLLDELAPLIKARDTAQAELQAVIQAPDTLKGRVRELEQQVKKIDERTIADPAGVTQESLDRVRTLQDQLADAKRLLQLADEKGRIELAREKADSAQTALSSTAKKLLSPLRRQFGSVILQQLIAVANAMTEWQTGCQRFFSMCGSDAPVAFPDPSEAVAAMGLGKARQTVIHLDELVKFAAELNRRVGHCNIGQEMSRLAENEARVEEARIAAAEARKKRKTVPVGGVAVETAPAEPVAVEPSAAESMSATLDRLSEMVKPSMAEEADAVVADWKRALDVEHAKADANLAVNQE